ncbi:hypothetical protein OG413_20605 [Streptomyces sp. NBC_01433]|uniref:hypothetical protein n=1 Tax=Streptomyces sp. NBC_01433 TaxID=2903864 RepID=UPI00224E3309|nr:hypothetical protein [Streptomyces sp. NBC_01433]MCX4677676.1 hypothetical protein [Streptomyces sp. NBC_01433]
MSITLTLPTVKDLTAMCGPLRTVLADFGPVDIAPEHNEVYSFEILGGKTLRESVINGEAGPVLIIRLVEYIDPVTHATRYGIEKWSVVGFRTVDHTVRLVSDAEYERQVRAEYTAPTLPMARERFTGGMTTFYDETDVL